MIFQLSRLTAGRITFRRNLSVTLTSAINFSHTSICKCGNCIKGITRQTGHNITCRCIRCYSTTNGTADNSSEKPPEATATTVSDDRDSKIAQLQDSYLRCLADMENLRQRTKKEVEAASSFAIQKFCKDIVSVADVLELAVGSVKNDPRTAKLLRGEAEAVEETDTPSDAVDSVVMQMSKEELAHRLKDISVGLSMTLAELVNVFSRHGVTGIDPLHQKFDPNFHMALYEVSNPELDAGTVVSVQKKGYLLNCRVIRPASVGVSKKD